MNNTVELIKVTGISPYSVFSGTNRYSFNKGVDSAMFVKGHTYSVSINIGKNGGKYINRVDSDLGELNLNGAPEGVATPLDAAVNQMPATPVAVNTQAAKPAYVKKAWAPRKAAATDSGLSKEEWADKDQRIKRSGLIQAAVGAVATHVTSLDQLGPEAIKLAEVMQVWVDNKPQVQPSPSQPTVSTVGQ